MHLNRLILSRVPMLQKVVFCFALILLYVTYVTHCHIWGFINVPYDQNWSEVCPVGRSKHKINNTCSYILHIIYIHSWKGSSCSTHMWGAEGWAGVASGAFNKLSWVLCRWINSKQNFDSLEDHQFIKCRFCQRCNFHNCIAFTLKLVIIPIPEGGGCARVQDLTVDFNEHLVKNENFQRRDTTLSQAPSFGNPHLPPPKTPNNPPYPTTSCSTNT